MDKQKLQPLKGFRDLGPDEMAVRTEAVKRLRTVFERYGFVELQTPTLEKAEVLLGKYGQEAEKLMYLFEDRGGRKVGLKYDLTVPLARYMAANKNTPLPFKRYQIQPVWRAENTQKGRYREFYQCDVDTIGSSSPMADAEILAVIKDALLELGFETFTTIINSRTVLFKTLESVDIKGNNRLSVIQTIDKLDKKSKEEVSKELAEKGLSKNKVKSIFDAFQNSLPDEYLSEVIKRAEDLGVDNLSFTPTLARGLDYYTGPIFETVVEKPKIGSLTGGGRYDNLIKSLGGPDLAAVGTSIGFERAVDVIAELGLWSTTSSGPQVFLTVFSGKYRGQATEAAYTMRKTGINTELSVVDQPLDKQLKYAGRRGIPFALIIGPNEAKGKSVTLKDLKLGTQETFSLERAIQTLQNK